MLENLDIKVCSFIPKGWSNDKKYYIETADGKKLLLRVADIKEMDRKKAEYSMITRVSELGVPVSQPIEFGICDDGESVYMLLSWCEGEDAAAILPYLSETEQYALGLKAGELLRKIHTLSAPDDVEPWSDWFYRKVQKRIDFYLKSPVQSENGDRIVKYLQNNKSVLCGRPQTFNHGDYNTSNLIVSPNGEVAVIDFNYYNLDHGDPWWELDSISWGEEPSAFYQTGLIKGYFKNEPPCEFFDVLSYYFAYDALAALCDTSEGEQGEPEDGVKHLENTLRWFDNMQNPVPSWYLKDFYIQWIDGVPYKLKAPFDFGFLQKYGTVFKVYDDQDSGNICFGVTNAKERYFVKFAGAPTARADISQQEAVDNLQRTVAVYHDLAHPNLVELVSSEEIGGGFAMVFKWTDGDCMGKMYPLARKRFMQMPVETKLDVFAKILEFHAYAAQQGYVAVDFYDGSIIYDPATNKTMICDIDYYAKMPFTNNIGRMWGSSRFMSPEEFALGATIDEVTNVFTMGATAFALFAQSKQIADWPLSQRLYDVVNKAVSENRSERQQSIRQLINEWNAALTTSLTN